MSSILGSTIELFACETPLLVFVFCIVDILHLGGGIHEKHSTK